MNQPVESPPSLTVATGTLQHAPRYRCESLQEPLRLATCTFSATHAVDGDEAKTLIRPTEDHRDRRLAGIGSRVRVGGMSVGDHTVPVAQHPALGDITRMKDVTARVTSVRARGRCHVKQVCTGTREGKDA